MEGMQDPAADTKGKGKAPEGETMEESMDDDSSDESGVEDHVRTSLRALPTLKAKLLTMLAFSQGKVR